MDKPVVADVADPIEQAVHDRLVDQRKALRDGFVDRRRDQPKREVTPDDCRRLHQPSAAGRDTVQPRPDDVEHGARRPVATPGAVGHRAGDLTDEQRVAAVTSRTARASATASSVVILASCSRTSARSKPPRSRRSTPGDRSRSGSTRRRTLAGSTSRNAARTSSRAPATWSARWRRTRSDGSSPQWMSSRMTTRPLLSATPHTASVTSSKTRTDPLATRHHQPARCRGRLPVSAAPGATARTPAPPRPRRSAPTPPRCHAPGRPRRAPGQAGSCRYPARRRNGGLRLQALSRASSFTRQCGRVASR